MYIQIQFLNAPVLGKILYVTLICQTKDMNTLMCLMFYLCYFRKFCGLPDAHTFDELFGSMSNETIRRYASIYEYVMRHLFMV